MPFSRDLRLTALVAILATLAAFALFATLPAHASPAPQSELAELTCAESYPERLADAQQAITAHARYQAEWQRAMPWFDQHCRFLTELERAIRKLDDPAAFVCDAKASGRPPVLTSSFVLEHSQPTDVVTWQEYAHLDDVCAGADHAAGRPVLVLREPTAAQRLTVLCYGSTSPKCERARAVLASVASRAGT